VRGQTPFLARTFVAIGAALAGLLLLAGGVCVLVARASPRADRPAIRKP
jgi:hypothetical protein